MRSVRLASRRGSGTRRHSPDREAPGTENSPPPPPWSATTAAARFSRDPAEYRSAGVQLALIAGGKETSR